MNFGKETEKVEFKRSLLNEGIISLSAMLNKESKRNVCWTIQDEQYQF